MKKILFILLVLASIMLSGCVVEEKNPCTTKLVPYNTVETYEIDYKYEVVVEGKELVLRNNDIYTGDYTVIISTKKQDFVFTETIMSDDEKSFVVNSVIEDYAIIAPKHEMTREVTKFRKELVE